MSDDGRRPRRKCKDGQGAPGRCRRSSSTIATSAVRTNWPPWIAPANSTRCSTARAEPATMGQPSASPACRRMSAREIALNIGPVVDLIARAREGGADLVLPAGERQPDGAGLPADAGEGARRGRAPGARRLRDAAETTGVWLLIGSLDGQARTATTGWPTGRCSSMPTAPSSPATTRFTCSTSISARARATGNRRRLRPAVAPSSRRRPGAGSASASATTCAFPSSIVDWLRPAPIS